MSQYKNSQLEISMSIAANINVDSSEIQALELTQNKTL